MHLAGVLQAPRKVVTVVLAVCMFMHLVTVHATPVSEFGTNASCRPYEPIKAQYGVRYIQYIDRCHTADIQKPTGFSTGDYTYALRFDVAGYDNGTPDTKGLPEYPAWLKIQVDVGYDGGNAYKWQISGLLLDTSLVTKNGTVHVMQSNREGAANEKLVVSFSLNVDWSVKLKNFPRVPAVYTADSFLFPKAEATGISAEARASVHEESSCVLRMVPGNAGTLILHHGLDASQGVTVAIPRYCAHLNKYDREEKPLIQKVAAVLNEDFKGESFDVVVDVTMGKQATQRGTWTFNVAGGSDQEAIEIVGFVGGYEYTEVIPYTEFPKLTNPSDAKYVVERRDGSAVLSGVTISAPQASGITLTVKPAAAVVNTLDSRYVPIDVVGEDKGGQVQYVVKNLLLQGPIQLKGWLPQSFTAVDAGSNVVPFGKQLEWRWTESEVTGISMVMVAVMWLPAAQYDSDGIYTGPLDNLPAVFMATANGYKSSKLELHAYSLSELQEQTRAVRLQVQQAGSIDVRVTLKWSPPDGKFNQIQLDQGVAFNSTYHAPPVAADRESPFAFFYRWDVLDFVIWGSTIVIGVGLLLFFYKRWRRIQEEEQRANDGREMLMLPS
eukprot:GFYU01030531.1.p1 GENE.GFYU01030531.1~~GFYU01030531.1.p1  ORF type:complete len:609 (-),score=142.74 GFYU01030531.1:164-1990(-)